MSYLLLEHSLADDYLERRAALREEHFDLARAAHERGELLLAGALPDPFDRALLVWTAPREVLERFAEQDPYVVHGLVKSWTVRPWNVVVGRLRVPPSATEGRAGRGRTRTRRQLGRRD